MALDKILGFPLEPVRMHPDGASTPPEVSPIAPPSNPAAAPPARLFEKTRIEGLTAPARPEELLPAPAPANANATRVAEPPRAPAPETSKAAASTNTEPARADAPNAPVAEPGAPAAKSSRRWLSARAGSRALLILALFSAVVGFGSAVLWSRIVHHAPKPTEHGAATADETALAWQNATPLASTACSLQREPKRVAVDVSTTLALEAHFIADQVDVLIGAAAAGSAALGLSLNATTLEATEIMRESSSRELLGVVPATDALPRFIVDRAGVGGYRDSRTLPDQTALALARTNLGIQLVRRDDQRAILLWPLHDGEEISRPRVEWLDASRLAVALRRGGRSGAIAIGWLDPARAQRSALRDVPFAGELGLPSLAVREGRAAVAAAVRMTPAHPWRIQVATSEWQGAARRVSLPELASRSELDTIAPSIAALDDSRWLLQWTEGREGERRVRAITLDADFHAVGASIGVSPKDASAGGGLVVPVDQGLLSLFLVQKTGGYDLWATTLACH